MPPKRSQTVYKCIRVKNNKRPLKSRCSKKLSKQGNGFLCDDCLTEAKMHKIPILMCGDVTSILNIPFKNQVWVWLDLSTSTGKSVEDEVTEKQREMKSRLWDKLDDLSIEKLREFYESMGFRNWDTIAFKNKNRETYRLRFAITKAIVNKFTLEGSKL